MSVWENEASVEAWRNQLPHRMAQAAGREGIFASYTITVAGVSRTYTMDERAQAPADSNAHWAQAE